MSRIIRERYENGILVERTVEGSNFKPWKWLQLVVHTVIAISLAVLVAVAVHDSLTLEGVQSEEETSPTSCEQSGFGRRIGGSMRKLIIAPLIAYLARLRFPVLFAIAAVLFILDFFIPDVIPFVDEILLGLGAALLGSWKKRKDPNPPNDPSGR